MCDSINNKALIKLPTENKTTGTDEKGQQYEIHQEGIHDYHDTITGKDINEVISKIKEYK